MQFLAIAGVTAAFSEIIHNTWLDNKVNYHIQVPIVSLLLCNMIERQELQADEFAYLQSVDSNIFNGANIYFNDEELQFNLYELQAPLYQRMDKMFECIKLLKNK